MTGVRRLTAAVLIAIVAAAPVAASQPLSMPSQATLARASAERIPAGSRVKVTLQDGARVHGVLMLVEGEELVVRERKRLPEPPRRIPLAEIAVIELDHNGGGASIAKAVAIGAGVGAGAALAVIAFLAAALND
jgi:hypothetical protein